MARGIFRGSGAWLASPPGPDLLQAGDVYTHCFHGFETTIMDAAARKVHAADVEAISSVHAPAYFPCERITIEGNIQGGVRMALLTPTAQVKAAAHEAKRRGVLFDIGHGAGSFNWTVRGSPGQRCHSGCKWPGNGSNLDYQ